MFAEKRDDSRRSRPLFAVRSAGLANRLFRGGGGAFIFAPEKIDLVDLGQFVAFPPGGLAVGVDDVDVPLLGGWLFRGILVRSRRSGSHIGQANPRPFHTRPIYSCQNRGIVSGLRWRVLR